MFGGDGIKCGSRKLALTDRLIHVELSIFFYIPQAHQQTGAKFFCRALGFRQFALLSDQFFLVQIKLCLARLALVIGCIGKRLLCCFYGALGVPHAIAAQFRRVALRLEFVVSFLDLFKLPIHRLRRHRVFELVQNVLTWRRTSSRRVGLLQFVDQLLLLSRCFGAQSPGHQLLIDAAHGALIPFPLALVVGSKHPNGRYQHQQSRAAENDMQQFLVVPGLFCCGHGSFSKWSNL